MPGEEEGRAEAVRLAPLVSSILAVVGASIRAGVTTKEIEARALEMYAATGLTSRMLGFRGFPAAICVSIDDEVLHGIPSDRTVQEGQLVTLQVGARTPHGFADQGWTFPIGAVSESRARLCASGIAALKDALAVVRDGATTGDIGAAISARLTRDGFSAVRDFTGYAIGAKPMQDPMLPCHGAPGAGPRVTEGMILHVHAIAALGKPHTKALEDGWTMRTSDSHPSALFSAIARVGRDGCDVLSTMLA
jgi:methionyl aminopeptidase